MKFFVKYASYIGIILSSAILFGLVVDKLTVYDEVTELGTFVFFNYSTELAPNFYSFVQLLATLPLVSILIITIAILGLYVKMNIEQARSKKSLDRFMVLSSREKQLSLLYMQQDAKNNLFFTKKQKLYFKTETNALINEFDAFGLETLDTTNLTVEEQLEIKNQTLVQYLGLKEFFEKVGDTIKLTEVITTISNITTEIETLTKKLV